MLDMLSNGEIKYHDIYIYIYNSSYYFFLNAFSNAFNLDLLYYKWQKSIEVRQETWRYAELR